MVIIAIVVAFGTEAVAGNAIGETLTQFNYMPVFGVATATVMLVARSLGEGDLEQIARLRKQSYWLSFVLMLPIALGIFFGGTLLTHLYTQDTKAVEASLSVVLFFFVRNAVYSRNGHLYSCLARLGKWETSILCNDDWHVGHSNWSRLSAWSNPWLWPSRGLDGDAARQWLSLAIFESAI